MRGGCAGGARDGEWAKERGGKGRGADTRRAHFSQISLHLCDKRRKEITASDEGNCKGTRITFLYVVRGGSQEAHRGRNERERGSARRDVRKNVL